MRNVRMLISSHLVQSLRSRHSGNQVYALYQVARRFSRSRSGKNKSAANKRPPDKFKRSEHSSLLRNITDIVGVDPSDSPIPVEINSRGHLEEARVQVQPVRQNAGQTTATVTTGEYMSPETSPTYEEMQEPNLLEEDSVSGVVHRVTEAVRLGNPATMEERLDELGIAMNPNIVEKVLKRCFKVHELAHRFFKWAKTQPDFCHTTGTYNVMLYIAGEAKDFDLVEALDKEMHKDSCSKNIKTWTILVSLYGKGMQAGKALKVFGDMTRNGCQPDQKIFEAMIYTLCKCGKSEVAVEFYKDMVSHNFDVAAVMYEKLMFSLSRSGDIAGVRLLADEMIKNFSESESYSCMLRSFCMAGRIHEAQDLVCEMKMKNLRLSSDDFRNLLYGLCHDGQVTQALDVMNDMNKHDFPLKSEDYGLIIYSYLKGNDITKALEVLHNMKRSDCLPTVTTYSQMIYHLLRSDDYGRACKLYMEMMESEVKPDMHVITTMISGHVQHNNIHEAWEVYKNTKRDGIKLTSSFYSLFVKELCKASRPDEVVKLFHEMSECSIKPNDRAVRFVTDLLIRNGAADEVRKIRQMFGTDFDSRAVKVVNELSAAQVFPRKASDISVSPETSYNQTEIGYNENDLNLICRILSSSKEWSSMIKDLEKSAISFTPQLVVNILHQCKRNGHAALQFFIWVTKQPGYIHNTETYNMAIKISGSAKDFKCMRELYLEMRRRKFPITGDTWTIMICQYGQAGLTNMALEKFKEMKKEGHMPKRSTYKFLILFLCGKKGRQVDQATKIFQEMIRAGFLPDKEVVEAYLCCLCETDRLDVARKTVEMLCENGFSVQVSKGLLVKSYCRAGRLEEAQTLVKEMEHIGYSVTEYMYGSLVHGLLRNDRLDDALGTIEAMNKDGLSHTVHIYTSLMAHYFKEKQTAKAIEIFNKMKEDGHKPSLVTYSALIRGYMKNDMVLDAWSTFNIMKNEGPKPDFKAYSMFIDSLCKVGRSEEAIALLHEMLSSGITPSAINFRTIFHGLNREGKCDLAQTVLQKKWSLSRRQKLIA